jgi:5-methyltetrahydrofolate--homocysteine methyltransferase
MTTLEDLEKCFTDLQGVEKINTLTERAVNEKIPMTKLLEAMKKGLDYVGERYEKGEYFLSDIIMAGVMATELTNKIKPHFTPADSKPKGKIVIGTVEGDIHDIGKNLVITMLSTHGYEVIDIGVDIPSEKFIESIEKYKPKILAMSCLLTVGMPAIEKTINLIKEKEMNVKILIGGRPITQEYADKLGVYYAKEAFQTVKKVEDLMKDVDENG